MHVVVTRPQPGATAARWRGRGATVTVAPLLDIAARPWTPPPGEPDAVAFTSANAVRLAGAGADRYRALPAFAVGEATAAAARAAGWR
ncbi:MAG: uroporphyrinogen-III synthase, partial [Sphingomonadaceae bacterium]|nr:uroporphyrinogen-III synthase [Sphingomonadaceae bacterium]